MKNLAIALGLSLSFGLSAQTVSTDFESSKGNRSAETCWGFGGFSLTAKSNHKPINGYSARSGSLNSNKNSFWMKSPFIELKGGNITFDARLSSSDGSRSFIVYVDFIPYDANDTYGEDDANIVSGGSYTLNSPQENIQAVSIPVPATVANNGKAYKVYWRFESAAGNRNRRMIVDNISIPGVYVSDPSNNCKVLTQVADSDFDGVDDDIDQYPNDPDRAYAAYNPGENTYGTFAYEDLWPAKGDYDFNDLVLDHQELFIFDANNRVKEIQAKFVVRALGGDLIQGFGVHFFGINPSQIESATGASLTTGTIATNANGTEQGQSSAVLIVCDDVEQVINRTSGAFFNTVPENPEGTSDTISVNVVFTTAISMSDMDNVSIFAYKNRDQEIHRKGKRPTDKADQSLFGTMDDASDPANGTYYCTEQGHPWAIELSQRFDYPAERVDIVQAYLNFANWAQSNGGAYENWYTQESGNRNSGNLY